MALDRTALVESVRRRLPWWSAGTAALGAAAAAARLADRAWWWVALLAVVAAGTLLVATWRRWTVPALSAVVAVPAAFVAAPRVIDRYPERLVVAGSATRYQGALFPVWWWTLLIAVAVAVVVVTLAMRRVPMALITAVAFLWRVYALVHIAPARTDGGDPLYYHTQANTLARGLGFIEPLNWIATGTRLPTAVHGPGYTLYLALFSRLGASTWFDHRMASSLAGTAVVLVAMLIARRLAGNWAALVTGLFAAFYPNMWTIDGVLFPEGLFVLFCGLAILFAQRWHDDHRRTDAALLGAAIGAAALTRGEGIFLVVLLAAPLAWRAATLDRGRRWRAFGVMVAGTAVVVGPWMVRNLTTFDRFVPLSTNGNELHVYSNCDDTYSGKFLGFWLFDCQQRIRDPNGDGVVDFEPAGDESDKAAYWQDVGFTYAREHAGRLPEVIAARIGRQWELFRPLQNAEFAPIEGRSAHWARIALGCYYALVLLAAVGVWRSWRARRYVWPLLAQFVAVTLTAAYAYGTIRFRAPAELALCVLAGAGCAPWAGRAAGWLRTRYPRGAIGGAAASTTAARRRVGGWIRDQWHVLVVAASILAITRGLYLAPGAPMEEGFMLVFPERMLHGALPNVDFLHLYGPASLQVLAAIYKIFGVSVAVERSVGLITNVAIVAALMVLARRWGRSAAAVTGLVAVLVVFTPIGLTALAWHGAVALALWSLVAAMSRFRHHQLLAAVLAGLALSYRPDIGVALLAAHGVRWWLDRPAGRRRLARPSGEVVAGALAGLAPLIVHVVLAGPAAVWRGVVTEPVFTLRAGRTLPRPPSWGHLDGALQVIGERPPPWWPLPAAAASHQLFAWFFILPAVCVVSLVLAVVWWRRSPSPRRRILVVASTFSVGLLTQALQRPDSTHLLWGSVVAFPLAGVVLAEWWQQRPGEGTRGGRLTVLLAPLAALVVVLPYYTARTYVTHVRQTLGTRLGGLHAGLPVVRGDRDYRLGDGRAWSAAQQLVDDLAAGATSGERLLVGPVDLRQTAYSDVFFYYLFPELTPATRYIEMDPGLANAAGSSLPADVSSADWLILTRFWSGWIEPNTSVVFGPDDANVVVEHDFCLVGSYEHDLARLYHRCPGGGAPGPYEGPYDPAYDYAVEVSVPVPPRSDGTSPATASSPTSTTTP